MSTASVKDARISGLPLKAAALTGNNKHYVPALIASRWIKGLGIAAVPTRLERRVTERAN